MLPWDRAIGTEFASGYSTIVWKSENTPFLSVSTLILFYLYAIQVVR
jgi:hypothetical protein